MAEITDYVNVSNLVDAIVDASEGQGIVLPGGEINKGKNVGSAGQDIYKEKVGVDLIFHRVHGLSPCKVETNVPEDRVDVSVDLAGVDHDLLANVGVNTHADIDSHIADMANPHLTDIGNLGSGTLAELNGALTDATLDDSGDPRTPSAHASDHNFGGSDKIAGDIIQNDPIVGSPANENDILGFENVPSKQWVPKPIKDVMAKLPVVVITTSPYALSLADGPYFISRYTGGPTSVIDLPDPASETPNDTTQAVYLLNQGTSVIQIQINAGAKQFSDGIPEYYLKQNEAITLELNQTTSGAVWSRRTSHIQDTKLRRVATWSSANFNVAPPKAIPFDTVDILDNPKVVNWPGADNTEIVINRNGRFKADGVVRFNTLVDSGPTTFVMEFRLNGTIIPGAVSDFRMPASLNTDPDLVIPSMPFDAVQGDILTAHVLATGLWDGELTSAVINVECEV